MENYQPIKTYKTRRIGPLRIEIPDEIDPNILHLIIEQEKRRREREDRPYVPLITPENPNKEPPKEH